LVGRSRKEARAKEKRISALKGIGGVGKTALAVKIAHRLTAPVLAAQLLVALRRSSENSVSSRQTMENVIRRFHPEAKLPPVSTERVIGWPSAPLAAQFEDRRGGKPRQRLREINRRLGYVSDRAAFRCDNGGRRLPLSKWSARNQASSSPCPPKTRVRCAAASLLPASSLRC
jgi:hypothetical protein